MLFRVFTLLAVVALAISTWILSSPAHRPKASTGATTVELPGYYLKNAILTDFDPGGAPSMHLQADRIDQVDHGGEVALSTVRVDYQAPNGQNWVLFGDYARVEPGGKIIDVNGNVRLEGASTAHAGTIVVHTDVLSYDVTDSIVNTESDVRVDLGARTVLSHGLVANMKERTMRLKSKVNARF